MLREDMEKHALILGLISCVKLANILLQNLEELSETEIENLLAEKALRRDEGITARKSKTIPVGVFSKIRMQD